ncbi:hypothetical protein [Desertivirga brevis]|uniref:hypothetical protein n=1 Tax=Desertivirga brevis TaxID=2810310 RepID=UPI001A979B0E|nr:hypothetical protein [Pedobacter sp. SYSU D00873]
MRRFFTLSILLFIPLFMFAQKSYRRLSIGAGAGITQMRGDLQSSQSKRTYLVNMDYYLTPFLAGVVEGQTGTISGQDPSSKRNFSNSYKSGAISMKMYVGGLTVQNSHSYSAQSGFSRVISGIFASAGVGVIQNNQTQIYRQSDDPIFGGSNSNKDIFVPLSTGIDNSGFGKRIVAGIRYQYNFVLGDQVDGYSTPGSRNDMYNTLTLSLKYKFGPSRYF